jgi:hypothetical protein
MARLLVVSEVASSTSIGSFAMSRSVVAFVHGVSVNGSSLMRPVAPVSTPCLA